MRIFEIFFVQSSVFTLTCMKISECIDYNFCGFTCVVRFPTGQTPGQGNPAGQGNFQEEDDDLYS